MSVRGCGLALLVGLVVGGCTGGTGGSAGRPDGTFSLPEGTEVTCLEHQQQAPGVDYTGGADGDTAAIFALLRYWAENGALPYCDGQPPTAVDLQWRDLVEQLGATRPPDSPGTTPGQGTTPDAPPTGSGRSSDAPAPSST